mmetsp:Transcript_26791/g.44656  ORF Transcript_26791/g.44656 Transcript_26791/m.44656 type:complete len:144 (-) Transcript_26791:113-544(-)|eukprot:CAMPEP_0119018760 /NCGR_PEP_ID=MMETSP1176-20130426/20179_1 /TAXON_ID=265551 /ORGANISM="Synedropsis recta cf, Strain CCMP1620" /LENGTH=143 /DNA_ID=CAMNT_0006972823 /DNA_START=91 /DNA_END=522 /DNA_ORIENTATION=-
MQVSILWKASLLVALCGILTVNVSAFVAPSSTSPRKQKASLFLRQFAVVALPTRRSPCLFMGDKDEAEEEPELAAVEEDKSILQKFNDFLDTPILDANNRSNEGPLKEALKEFARDEPELAQVSFSVVVIAILLVITKLVTSF